MFPLGSVLLPGGVLPLHVFEPRYRQLVQDCMAAEHHEFGVVLIQRGSEVGGGDVRSDVGVVAQMLQVAEMDDGRYAVISIGTRRFRVDHWLPDDPYPRADVEDWDDPPPPSGHGWDEPRVAALTQRVRRLSALALELGDHTDDPNADVHHDLEVASYQLSAMAPVGTLDSYRLLCAPDPAARLTLLDGLLDDIEPVLAFRLNSGDR
jgi:Lon protease-like protein